MKVTLGIEKSVGDEGMDLRMEIEVFAEGMEGQEERRRALREIQSDPKEFSDGLLGKGAKPFQQAAIAQEGRAERVEGAGRFAGAVKRGGSGTA